MSILSAFMSMYHTCAVSMNARRGESDLLLQELKLVGLSSHVGAGNQRVLKEKPVSTEPSLQPPFFSFGEIIG